MSKKRHSRLPREQRMRAIMQVATQVFRDKGYSEALTAQIAARAGVVEGTIYRYFPGKRELLIRVVEQWYEGILADYDQQLAALQGTRARLRFLIWRHLSVIHREPGMCRLIFQQLRAWPEYRRTTVFELTREYTRRTLEILQQGIDAGEFRADVPLRIVRDLIYGGVEHHTWVYLRGEGDFSPDAAADAMTDMVYRGLALPALADAQPAAADVTLRRLEAVAQRLERSTRAGGRAAPTSAATARASAAKARGQSAKV
jgi:AcrR family transcriptional regulator